MKITPSHLAGLAIGTAIALNSSTALAAFPTLGNGVWTITGSDVTGNSHTGSKITFESQIAQGDDYKLTGFFDWTLAGGQFGREKFTGTLFANNRLTLKGFELVPPTSGIVTNVTYNAEVVGDGTRMINGTWGGGGSVPSNAWTAVQSVTPPRSVPEPGIGAMLAVGGVLMFRKPRAKTTA